MLSFRRGLADLQPGVRVLACSPACVSLFLFEEALFGWFKGKPKGKPPMFLGFPSKITGAGSWPLRTDVKLLNHDSLLLLVS